MEWDREKCLKLMDTFEQYPVLWNPRHGLYYNKVKKYDAWVSIGEMMQCGSVAVKKKMESILASFRREKSKGKKTIGTGKGRQEIYISKWFAFTRMSFLLDRDEPTQTVSSLEDNIETEEAALQDTCPEVVVSTNTNGDPAENSTENPESNIIMRKVKRTLPLSVNKRAKQKVQRKDDKIDEAFEMLKSVVEKPKPEEKSDACSDYGKHVGNKMRNYSERTKAIVQYHINNLLFQADMNHFEKVSTLSFNNQNNDKNFSYNAFSANPTTTTPIPAPSPQESTQSQLSCGTDLLLQSQSSELNYQEQSYPRESTHSPRSYTDLSSRSTSTEVTYQTQSYLQECWQNQ